MLSRNSCSRRLPTWVNKWHSIPLSFPKISQFNHSVVLDSLWPHGCQASLPSPTPRACLNSCPSNWWCHPIVSSSVFPFSSAFNLSQHQGLFQWVSSSYQVAKILEFRFSISPSNECSGLISFRIDWFDLLAIQGTLRSLLQHHSSKHQFFGTQRS